MAFRGGGYGCLPFLFRAKCWRTSAAAGGGFDFCMRLRNNHWHQTTLAIGIVYWRREEQKRRADDWIGAQALVAAFGSIHRL